MDGCQHLVGNNQTILTIKQSNNFVRLLK